MKKNLMKFITMVFATAAACGAYGADDAGDIRSIEAANSAAVHFPNGTKPLRAGEDFYILVRLANQDYDQKENSHAWQFLPTGLVGSDYLNNYMYVPKLGISVGGKRAYAEYSDVGPNGEKSGRRADYPIFTDLYFRYAVQPGDLGLPVKLVCKDGSIATDPNSNTDFDLVNVNTATLTLDTNPWKLGNAIPAAEGGRLVNFHFGKEYLNGDPDEPSEPQRDVTFVKAGVYVQTIDFDEDIDADAKVWRDVYPKSAEYVVKAPAIEGVGPAVVYVWSGNPEVFDVYSANAADVTEINGTNYLKVTIGAGESSATFRLRGGTAATDEKAQIYMASSTADERSEIGDVIEHSTVSRTVRMAEPPPPNIKVTFDTDGLVTTKKVNPIPDCPVEEIYDRSLAVPLYITLSETYPANFTLKLNPTVTDAPDADIFASKFLGMSVNGGSSGYMEKMTNITIAANTKQVTVWLYPIGADSTTQNGIAFNPEIVEPAAEEKYHGNVSGCTLSLYDCKPTVVSPTPADSLSADKKRGCDIAIEITDSFRDLNAPQLYTVEYTWVGGGTAGSVENQSFRAGQATTITAQGFASKTTGVKIRVKDAQDNYSSWSEAVPVFVEATKTVKPELVREQSETAPALEVLKFSEGDTVNLRFRVEPDTAANMADMYAFLVPLNAQSSNLVTSTAFAEGVPFEAEKTVSKVISTAALTFLDGCTKAEDLRFGVMLRTEPTLTGGVEITDYLAQTMYVSVTNRLPSILQVSKGWDEMRNGSTAADNADLAVAAGVQSTFTATLDDLSVVDITNRVQGLRVYWYVTDGKNAKKEYVTDADVDGVNATATLKVKLNAKGKTAKIEAVVRDKDMTDKDFTLAPRWTFELPINEKPFVSFSDLSGHGTATPGEDLYYDENVSQLKGKVNVNLSLSPNSLPDGVKLQVAVLHEPVGSDGNLDFTGYDPTEGWTVVEVDGDSTTAQLQIDVTTLDGGVESAFQLSAEVLDAYDDDGNPILDENGEPWSKHYSVTPAILWVNNVAPAIRNWSSNDENLPMSLTATNQNVSLGKKYDVEWTVGDVKPDLAADQSFTVTWTTSCGLNVEQRRGEMTYDPAKKTLSGKVMVSIDLDGFQSLTMTATDKDGGSTSQTWWYEIPQTKKAVVTAFGPADSTQSKYGNAIGLGLGRLYADDLASSKQDGFAHTFCFNVTMSKANVYAFGYPAGAAVTDDGTLQPAGKDIRINAQGGTWNVGEAYYMPDSEYDSFFYCWVDLSKEAALPEGSSKRPNPAARPDTLTKVEIALGEAKDKKEGAEQKTLEAVFSREMYASDNLGDINQDGIPDLYVTLYKFGIFDAEGGLAGDDLAKLDTYNSDQDGSGAAPGAEGEAKPDFLPYMEVSQYSVLIPELPSTWSAEGLPFDAVTEIRGYHYGLNDATAQKTVDGKNNPAAIRNAQPDRVYGVWDDAEGRWTYDPDKCTISELEFEAWCEAGCPEVDRWSPERPTSPMLYDTDGDGFSDGYEYFMWYRAHVGYRDGEVHRYLTGCRFDPENPGMGTTITSEEIARLFDPIAKSGDASESLTRDTDNDGLPDILEFLLGTNPVHWDTDGDGLPDGYEVAMNGGTKTEGEESGTPSIGGIEGQGEAEDAAKTVFDPCGRNVGTDEAMYNGDQDAMAYAPASENAEPVYGFLQADGTIEYYWIPGATNVVSTNATPCWAFTRITVATNRQTGAEYATTNTYLTANRPSAREVNGEWILTQTLTERECWLGGNGSTNKEDVALIRAAPVHLDRGFRMSGEPVETNYFKITYGGKDARAAHRVFKYGPNVYDPAQPYGNWVCGAETFPRGVEIVSTSHEPVFFIHTHVFQGAETGDGARTPWNPSTAHGGGNPYTQLDEFLVCFYFYLDEQPDPDNATAMMDITPTRRRSWPMIWGDYCTDPSTADTDGDGIPDGWELFTMGGPKAYGLAGRVRDYGPHSDNSPKNPAGGFASEWHGSTCSLFYGPYCKSIVDSYCVTHPFWSNKKMPTDPWVDDTDGDGIPDDAEQGVFAYLAETPAWAGREPSYPDNIPPPGAGGGLDPLSWDTDMDGLPDPWEMQYGTDAMGRDETYKYDGEMHEDGSEPLNCWCRENEYGKLVPTVDGTVADAGEDYDHDGLLNWQEYLVSAMRCWRYDDTISAWGNTMPNGMELSTEALTEALINGGAIPVKTVGEDGKEKTVLKFAGIDDWFEYDGQYALFNPQMQVAGMWDIGAGWFSLCTNEFDQAKGKWYMFYDGVYHDLRTGDAKWTVPGMPPDCCNRFTWRAYTLWKRNPLAFCSDPTGQMGYWFGNSKEGDFLICPKRYPGTDPNDFDTDDDGLDDYWELFHGLNPLLGQSNAYRTSDHPPVDCVYEAYIYRDGRSELDTDPETGNVRAHCSAEKNYWTFLNQIEPNSPHFSSVFPQRTRGRLSQGAEQGVLNTYDFGRFPWLNGLAYADPDGDNIRNQQEGIFPQVQANTTYLHTDPSPLWMTDKSYGASLTYRYYKLPDYSPIWLEDAAGNPGFTDAFGQKHKWTDFPGYEYDDKKGLHLPNYTLAEWPVPNPSGAEAANLATVTVAGFGWDFEENEGYDTDHDYLSDFEEQQGRTKNASDPQDTDDPLRRQAMWFGGEANRSVLQGPPELDRLPPNDSVPTGVDQPYLYFTVECWAKPEGDVNRDQVLVERTIWTSQSNPADDRLLRKNFQIGIHGSDAGALWYVKFDSTGTDDQKPIEIANGPAVETNGWTHIAVTFDGSSLKMFVNGIAERTLATKAQPEHGFKAVATDHDGTFREGSITYPSRVITLGASIYDPNMINVAYPYADWNCYNQYYQGYIDEVRIWDGARTEAEIMANYRKRFTAADAAANRDQVYSAWSLGYTREAVTTGVLPAELKLHWNFDHIPGATQPNWVMRQPAGFTTPEDVVDGKAIWSRPKDWVEPWWAGVVLKSSVYDDPAWVPWIIDTVHHLPLYDQTTLDSVYWSENYVGSTSVRDWAANYFGSESTASGSYTKFAFPRTHETPVRWTQVTFEKGPPYSISTRYRMVCELLEREDAAGETAMKKYAFTMRHALTEGFDLLPLGGAYAKRISRTEGGMWDENGAADAWAQTGNGSDTLVDPTDKGVPDWWTEYYLQNHPELDPDMVIRWDTPVDYDGMTMPAWQAYIRDLQKGLLPDGKYHDVDDEFVDTVDYNGNGIPDWWETYWKLANADADADPDNDGLSTYAEYLSGDGAFPYGTVRGFPFVNPNLTRTFGNGVTDYYLPGPATNVDANGRHVYGGEYLGEIFTDHDFMEDWWERKYPRSYVNPKIYDPWEDADGDGWSNFAECRASLWSGYLTADLVDHWEDAQDAPASVLVRDCPSPAIRLNLSYRGKQDPAGKPVVLRTSTVRETADATFVVSAEAPEASGLKLKYLGGFNSESVLHGSIGDGSVLPGSVSIQRALTGYGRTYTWNWTWYDTAGYAHPKETEGDFALFRQYLVDYPKIEFESSYLTWTPIALSIEDNSGRSAALLCLGNQTEIGSIDIATGEYTVDLTKFAATDLADPKLERSIFRISYQSRLGNSYPQSITFSEPTKGFVREGANTLEVFVDMDGSGTYTPGEPFATVKNVPVGWHKVNAIDVELLDTSHVMPRFSVAGGSDRETLTGTSFSGKVGEEGEGGEGGEAGGGAGLTTTLVIRRKTINGFTASPYTGDRVPQRNLLTKTLVLADRDYLHEGDVLSTEKLDLDWNWLMADAAKLKLSDVTSVGYDVEQVIPLDGNQTSNAVIHSFVNTFATTRTKPVAVNYADDAPLYTAAPTFVFQAGDATMTAYKLQVWSSTNFSNAADLVFDTGFKPLPGASSYRDNAYAYRVTPELYVDCAAGTNGSPVFADVSNYYWRVALGNAKFTTAANGDESAWSGFNRFQTDVMNTNRYPNVSTGYGRVGAAVRYYGLAKTNDLSGKVVVEVFSNGDFTGLPLARKRLSYDSLDAQLGRMTNLVDTTVRDVLFAGIMPGAVFIRAYVDSNNNNRWDRWEPWGYAAETGVGKSTIFNPQTAAVDDSSANMNRPPLLTVFMEDTDLNQNEIPDVLEDRYRAAEGRGSDDPVAGDTDGDGLTDEQETNEYTTNPAVVDTDDDGMWDGWEVWAGTDPLFADGEECADGDVMAYVLTNAYLVTINKKDENTLATYLVTDLAKKPVNGDPAANYELHKWFEYGSKTLYGVGGVATVPAGTLVDATEEVDAVFVHSQVYDKFGFDPNTANPATTNGVNTKPFTALDKYLTIRYFESLGLCSEKNVNATRGWEKWSLKVGDDDCDMDGVPDGWELYVMFGTNAVKSAEAMKVSPFVRADARGADLDGDTLKTLAEFSRGGIPTDPWKPNSMYDYLSANGYLLEGTAKFGDAVAKSFGDWAELGEDGDLDLVYNFQEMQGYYLDPAALADLDYRNAWSDGETPDYFRRCGGSYLGEVFNGAEFIEPWMRWFLEIDDLEMAGTRDWQNEGWDAWSVTRYLLGGGPIVQWYTIGEDGSTNEAEVSYAPMPNVDLAFKYAGNGSKQVKVQAYQVNPAYPEYGEALQTEWDVAAGFDGGLAKVTLNMSNRVEHTGTLKQGHARFVAYIDRDGDGKLSPADAFGTAEAEIGYLGAALEMRLGEYYGGFPLFEFQDGSNVVSQLKIVRTHINGRPVLNPHTVFFREYANNVERATVFPDDFVLSGSLKGEEGTRTYVGLDRGLANVRGTVDSVTYEVLVGPGPFTVSNLTEFATLSSNQVKTAEGTKWVLVTNSVSGIGGNRTFTAFYSHRPDVADVIVSPGQLKGDAIVAFTVPKDTPATKFWLKLGEGEDDVYPKTGTDLGGKTYTRTSGFLIPPAADGVCVIRLNDYVGDINPESEYKLSVALGNDRWPSLGDAKWSAPAEVRFGEDPTFDGKIGVQVKYTGGEPIMDWRNVVVAAYERPDLANAASTAKADSNGYAALKNLLDGREYYVAAWYVKNADDGRLTATSREPYDTWGYATLLGVVTNGFAAAGIPARSAVSVTNDVYLQDTDYNANGVIDRKENFLAKSAIARKGGRSGGGSVIYLDDFDLDGLPDIYQDSGEEEEEEEDRTTGADVMAYFEVEDMTYVALGRDDVETNWVWCAVLDARDPVTGYRLTDGTVKLQTPADEITSLYSVYSYFGTQNDPQLARVQRRWEGIGTNVSYSADWKVREVRTGKAKFVHAQVYALFGYEPETCVPGSTHHTKAFAATDKYLVCRYLEAIGVRGVDERLMATNVAYQWIWTLPPDSIDSDRDGIADGWELYTMFGPGGYSLKTGVNGAAASALTNAVADGIVSPFDVRDGKAPAPGAGSGLELIEEYDNGRNPTDPWAVDTDRDGVADVYAYRYHLKGEDSREDWDNDGLSNYAEYLISEVFRFAKCNPDDPRTSDGVVDAYKKVGDLYFGELFSDHDQMEDDVEDRFPELSRSLYDAHLDSDNDGKGDGWSNYAEVRAYLAAGMTNVEYAVTNDGKVVKMTELRSLYTGVPQPKIRLTLNYFGSRLPAGKTTTAVVKAYGDGPAMMRNDAVYVVSNVVYGVNRVVLEKPVSGAVREGANWFAAYLMESGADDSGSGSASEGEASGQFSYAAGMPFGSVGGVRIGWAEPAVTVTVTDQSPVFDRIDLYAGTSSRQYENGEPKSVGEIEHDQGVVDAANVDWTRERVRLVPYAVRGTKQDGAADPALAEEDVEIVTNGLGQLRVAADFYIDRNNHSMISEADVIDEVNRKFDLDWDGWASGYFTSQRMTDAVGEVTLVKYRVILGEGSDLGPLSNFDVGGEDRTVRVFTFPVERRFEDTNGRTKAEVVSPVGGGVVYSGRPTFRWRLDEPAAVTHGYGSSYTAFQIVLFDENDEIVYDSGFQRAPAKDANGVFAWTAPICVGAPTPTGALLENGAYRWQVQMYNAKFRNAAKAQWASGTFALAAGLQQEVNDGGYGRIDVAVRYAGPSEVLEKCGDLGVSVGKVVVEAYDTPDFTGDPLAATVATNAAAVANAFDATNTVSLVGLPMGGTYYVRAFIDSNGNGVRDDFESWGCVNRIGEKDAAGCYEPKPVALAASLVRAPVVGLFIDDADTDQDWIPDALEYAQAGWTGDWKDVRELQKAAVAGTISIDTSVLDGTAGISSGLIGAPLTVFENGAFAKQMLGIDSLVSFADIRAAIDRTVQPTAVKISALKLDKDKVILDLDADVGLPLAGRLVSQVYGIVPSGTAKVTVRVLRRTSLAARDDWQEAFVKENVEIGPGQGSVEIPLGSDVDLSSGFYKVEVVQ